VGKWLTMSEPLSLGVSGPYIFLFGRVRGIGDIIKCWRLMLARCVVFEGLVGIFLHLKVSR